MASVSPVAAPAPAKAPSAVRIQLDTLTGVRGLLSLTVFLGHAGIEPVYQHAAIGNNILKYDSGMGEAAVSFFFMLSGFVLVWASRPSDTRRSFYRRRFFKIFPNHLATWTTGLVLMIVAGEFTNVWNVLPSLPLLQVWIPSEGVLSGTNGPSWSLSVEVFFYALFPLMLIGVNKIRESRLWQWVFGTAAAIILFTVIVGLTVPSMPQALDQPVSLYQFYILIFIPPVRLVDFLLGMLVCRLVIAGKWPEVKWAWVWAAFFVGWVFSVTIPAPLGFVAPMVLPNVLLLAKAATSDVAGRQGFFTTKTMVWLGEVSFGFYLVHWLVLHYGRVFLGGGPWNTPLAFTFIIGALFLSLALGECLRRYLEIPMMRRYARPRRKPAPAAVPDNLNAGDAGTATSAAAATAEGPGAMNGSATADRLVDVRPPKTTIGTSGANAADH